MKPRPVGSSPPPMTPSSRPSTQDLSAMDEPTRPDPRLDGPTARCCADAASPRSSLSPTIRKATADAVAHAVDDRRRSTSRTTRAATSSSAVSTASRPGAAWPPATTGFLRSLAQSALRLVGVAHKRRPSLRDQARVEQAEFPFSCTQRSTIRTPQRPQHPWSQGQRSGYRATTLRSIGMATSGVGAADRLRLWRTHEPHRGTWSSRPGCQ
jgi:hypothetical protein